MTGSSPPKKQSFMSRMFSSKTKAKKTPSHILSSSSPKKTKKETSTHTATKKIPFLSRFRRPAPPSTMDKIVSKLHVSSSSSPSSTSPSPAQVAAAKKKKKAKDKKAKAKKEAEKKKKKSLFFGNK